MEPIFFLKKMGFSFDEMAKLKMDEYGDIIEMSISSMPSEEEEIEEIIDAGQAEIDAFFK